MLAIDLNIELSFRLIIKSGFVKSKNDFIKSISNNPPELFLRLKD